MKHFFLIISLATFILSGCKTDSKNGHAVSTNTFGLATPINLTEGQTTIFLEDYFKDISKIDSLTSNVLLLKRSADGKQLSLTPNNKLPYLSELKIWENGNYQSILVKKSLKRKTRLSIKFDSKTPKLVQLVGDLNNWNPANSPMTKNGNEWYTDLKLNPGQYPYQFIVDGKWQLDPGNPKKMSNGMGGFNSSLIVKKPALSDLPYLSTFKTDKNKIIIHSSIPPKEIFAFWQNHRLVTTSVKGSPAQIALHLPENCGMIDRSVVRVWAYNNYGNSNDLFIPLDKGKVVKDTDLLERSDKRTNIMYFTLIDRFFNGNKDNDEPVKDNKLTDRENYQGGDIAGITAKIKNGYFKELGMNTLWLSPITQNPETAYQEWPEPKRWYSGYHGYWPISSSKVDHRFGTDKELTELVTIAHDNGMNVLLDYVCNHVHEEHPIYKNHKEWATQLKLPDGSLNIRIWDEQRLTTWFDTFLPTLDLSNPEVIDVQTDSAIYWIKKFDLDGFRHDATKHIPEEFWRTLTRKLKEEVMVPDNKPLYQIGETFGSRELIASYISSGQLDAQFDFGLYFDARDVFAKDDESFDRLANSMRESFDYFGHHSTMGNITGNHDLTRFMGLASGAVKFDEDPKEAGYTRDVQVKDPIGYQKLTNMIAFLMTVPGIPVVYYGDEIGMVGAGDPDNRRLMKFDNLGRQEGRVKFLTGELAKLRRSHMSLMYGDLQLVNVEKDILVFARTYFGEVTVVAINKNKEGQTFKIGRGFLPWQAPIDDLKPKFNFGKLASEGELVKMNVPGMSFEIWSNH